jgi:cardiolipin synthase
MARRGMDAYGTVGIVVLVTAGFAAAAIASGHAILRKADVRAAIGWVGLIWMVPLVGPALYGLLGVNRISRRASHLRRRRPQSPPRLPAADERPSACLTAPESRHLAPVAGLLDAVTPAPLVFGNRITPYERAEDAFAAMLAAVRDARRTVGMASYIFDNDAAGRRFADALVEACRRGIAVRVLIDGVGARYSYPPITASLRRRGVAVAEFLPTFVPLHLPYANLRNHRKILVVDGLVGFTGGMNVRSGYFRDGPSRESVRDLHFRVEGPVVVQLADAFAEDWAFTTREVLDGDGWFAEPEPVGGTAARAIASGPDEEIERIRWAILAALSQARWQVRVVTPYFLPDRLLTTALVMAAVRGVRVEILLPERNNLRLVQWASKAQLGRLLAAGCRVYETPPPFDHAKMMTVDGAWSLIGSANWDERSLRLNFELNLECYDSELATQLDRRIDAKLAVARELTLTAIRGRSLAVKLRDAAAWLFSPYL